MNIHLRRPDVLDIPERHSIRNQFHSDLLWREEQLKRLPRQLNSLSERVMSQFLQKRQRRPRLTVIEHHATPDRLRSDKRNRRTKSIHREIRNDSKPCKKSWNCRIESNRKQLLRKRLTLEINRSISKVRRSRQPARLN